MTAFFLSVFFHFIDNFRFERFNVDALASRGNVTASTLMPFAGLLSVLAVLAGVAAGVLFALSPSF